MIIEVKPYAFMFPEFITIREFVYGTKVDVGYFSPAEAMAYWEELKPMWVAHVEIRRRGLVTAREALMEAEQQS